MQGNPALTGKCCHVNEMLIEINRLCSVLSVCFNPNSHRLLLPLCAPYKDRMSEEIKHSPRGIRKKKVVDLHLSRGMSILQFIEEEDCLGSRIETQYRGLVFFFSLFKSRGKQSPRKLELKVLPVPSRKRLWLPCRSSWNLEQCPPVYMFSRYLRMCNEIFLLKPCF